MYPGTWAETMPDKPAMVMAGAGETLTYRQLDERSARLARHLHDAGLRTGDVVAMVSDNRLETYEVYWAVMRSGLQLTAVNSNVAPEEVGTARTREFHFADELPRTPTGKLVKGRLRDALL